MDSKAKEKKKRIIKKHLISELKALPQIWSKTTKLNHLKRLIEYQTNSVFVDTKIDRALRETTNKLLQIDPSG